MAAVTRLGLYGGTRSLYGSFAGKEEGEVVSTQTKGGISRRRKKLLRQKQQKLLQEVQAKEQKELIARIEAPVEEDVVITVAPKLPPTTTELMEVIKGLQETVVELQTPKETNVTNLYSTTTVKTEAGVDVDILSMLNNLRTIVDQLQVQITAKDIVVQENITNITHVMEDNDDGEVAILLSLL